MSSSSIHSHQRLNIYDPLPDGPYIRVLVLEPGRRRQLIRCRLGIVNLEEKPDFEAISYAWGRGIKRKKVVCNGIRIKITTNLLQALVAVRHPSRQRTIWVDSISINQSDNEEKSRQVALMGPIYNRARGVLIHLAGDDRGHARAVATFVSDKLAIIRQSYSPDLEAGPYQPAQEMQLLIEDPRFRSLKYLLDRRWFKRGWVIQEAVLAQDAVIIWGSRRVCKLDSLMICHSWLSRGAPGMDACSKYNVNPLLVLSHLYCYRFREVAQGFGYTLGAQPNFMEVLHLARPLKLKDPRDRVYAFLYLDHLEDQFNVEIDVKARLAIEPDYSRPVAEVYADLVRHTTKSGNIEWLYYVQHSQTSLVDTRFASWAPRWDVHNDVGLERSGRSIMNPSHQTRKNGQQDVARFDGNCLIVPGVVFDRVRACQCYISAGRPSVTLNDVASFWRLVRTFDLGSAYQSEYLGFVLLQTLTQGYFVPPWSDWSQEREVFLQFLLAAEEDMGAARRLSTRIPRVERAIRTYTTGRKLISTDRGYFGLAPLITEEDDVCCIIFGCLYPFILRQADNPSVLKPQRFRVVGDVWVAGSQVVQDSENGWWIPGFGSEYNMEWQTWGLKEGDINLI